MKKILLSIFAVLFAFAGVQAQETAILSFADKAQRTLFTTEQQVWEQNGITFTNNKASSTNNVADYANPVRLYAKSEVIVEHANTMTQIVFTCSSNSYATALKNSIGDAATVSGSDVTVVPNSTTFTFALTAQVRVKSITVTYTAGGGEIEPGTPVATLPAVSVKDGAKIALGTEITITPAAGNTVQYAIDDSNEFIEITEAETITADVAGVMTLNVVSTCGEESVEAEYVYTVMPNKPVISAADDSFEESLEVSIEAEDGNIYYTLDGNDPTEESTLYESAFTITETTTVKAIAVVNGVASEVETAKYSKTVVIEGAVIDVLNRELTGISGTSYSSWSGKTVTSAAVYAGQSAGGNSSIQLRSNSNNSGVITTASGGKVKKIVVVWDSNTTNGRTLNVYGKNTAYSAPTDLYSTSTQGTLLGTIVCGTSTELVIEGDYEYIGMRSASGAMYLTSISITWDESAGVTPVAPNAPILPALTTFKGSMLVEITGIAADATVYYTTDESDPATSATRVEYTEPFEITATTTVKAVAVNEVGTSEMATATYTLFVVEETTGYYVEVVSAPADWSGKYLIVYEDGIDAYVFNGEDIVNGYVSAVTDGDVIKANSEIDAVAVTIAAMEGGYSISTVSGYMYKTAYSNGVDFGETAMAANTFEIAEDGVVITSGNNDDKTTFRYNKTDGQNRFRYYKSGQQPVQLYKYVEELPLYQTHTVTEAGYATLYLGFNARIPSAVEAYTVTTVNSGWVSLTQVTGVLPANTGVIIKAPAGEYKLFNEATATADVTGNLLSGSTYNKNIEEEAYVLGKVDGVVGLYKAEMNQMDGTAWLNNANKAYLPASAVPNKSVAFYGFDWNGTTGIDQITENREQSTAIYDLTGRRVEAISAPGIYVVGGRKVLVK